MPSPNDQLVEAMVPSLSVEVDVSVTASGAVPVLVEALPMAVGAWLAAAVMATVAESVAPWSSVTVRVAM